MTVFLRNNNTQKKLNIPLNFRLLVYVLQSIHFRWSINNPDQMCSTAACYLGATLQTKMKETRNYR